MSFIEDSFVSEDDTISSIDTMSPVRDVDNHNHDHERRIRKLKSEVVQLNQELLEIEDENCELKSQLIKVEQQLRDERTKSQSQRVMRECERTELTRLLELNSHKVEQLQMDLDHLQHHNYGLQEEIVAKNRQIELLEWETSELLQTSLNALFCQICDNANQIEFGSKLEQLEEQLVEAELENRKLRLELCDSKRCITDLQDELESAAFQTQIVAVDHHQARSGSILAVSTKLGTESKKDRRELVKSYATTVMLIAPQRTMIQLAWSIVCDSTLFSIMFLIKAFNLFALTIRIPFRVASKCLNYVQRSVYSVKGTVRKLSSIQLLNVRSLQSLKDK